MAISEAKARYFFHRWLEQYDPQRAIEKWNKGYPNDPATAAEIEAFLAEVVNRMEAGQRDADAIAAIVAGSTELIINKPRSAPPPTPGEGSNPENKPLVSLKQEQTTIPVLTVTEGGKSPAPLPKKKFFAKKEK